MLILLFCSFILSVFREHCSLQSICQRTWVWMSFSTEPLLIHHKGLCDLGCSLMFISGQWPGMLGFLIIHCKWRVGPRTCPVSATAAYCRKRYVSIGSYFSDYHHRFFHWGISSLEISLESINLQGHYWRRQRQHIASQSAASAQSL